MATFGYGRVSTKDQTAENQRLELERAGYSVDYWFADEGVSGKVQAGARPQFSSMLDKMRDGETVVVTKLDRLGRDAIDVGCTIRTLASRNIKVVVLQLGNMDLNSAAGKLMLTMLSAVAEMERDFLIERTQAGLFRAKSQGKRLGRPSKTTDVERDQINLSYATGATVSELARRYAVSRATILSIVKACS